MPGLILRALPTMSDSILLTIVESTYISSILHGGGGRLRKMKGFAQVPKERK